MFKFASTGNTWGLWIGMFEQIFGKKEKKEEEKESITLLSETTIPELEDLFLVCKKGLKESMVQRTSAPMLKALL